MEMNMHMPQNILAETELRHLAAIPYQIISPTGNSPIIGIYQDNMLGSYRFTRPNIKLGARDAMNLLMMFPNVDVKTLYDNRKTLTSFDILSQIMPPITLKYETKLFEEGEDKSTSNNVMEIRSGQYIRGQMEKGVLGSGTKGILHRIFNDYGNMECARFIDNLQNVVTEYMKSSAFSVGISDLVANKKTQEQIMHIIQDKKSEVQMVVDKVHLGIFENDTSNTNMVQFETTVNNILNQATAESGKEGRKSLSKDNRFVMIVNSGSKGSLLNISQMISCLGQQNVDAKRIPYGFDSRTLPHFNKFDDSPEARGFIENSYISGLSATDLFFHAMGGRIGLIDTACKTSQTGYIQRRLIKGLEDLKVEYDMTVRNNRGKIVQFAYGDDGFDSTKVENQAIPIVGMSIEDIYMHYDIIGINDTAHSSIQTIYSKGTANRMKKQREETMIKTKTYIDMMLEARETVIQNIFKYKNDKMVRVPVAFQYIITNIQHQLGLNSRSITDITPLEAFQLIENTFKKLEKIHFAPPTPLFKILYYYYLSPRYLLVNKRFHRKGLELILETVVLKYKQALVHPGEMVGVIAGQSIGEPTTQLTLNSVTYETEIVVRNHHNEIKKVQIGDFVTEHMDKSLKKEYMANQDTTYAELSPDEEYYEIPSANEAGETVWTRIEAVTQHPVINTDGTDTMLKITTEGCREVIVTKAKSVLQLVDGKIVEVSGEDIKIGDFLPASKKPLEYQEVHNLDLREILDPTKYLYGSEYHKAMSYMTEPRWWLKHAGKDFIVPHSRSDSFVELTKANKSFDPTCVYMKLVNMCDYNVPAKIPLDYDFGYLVGAYCAEGCMTAHQISIANNDLEYLKPIERLCQKWNITTKIYCDKDKIQEGWTSQNLRIYNTVLCRILESLCGKLSHNKFVSDKIVFSNKECILGFLDAYIAGDGCIHKSSTGTHRICDISMTSVSKTILTDVMIMLKNLGIVATMHMPKKIEKNNRGSQNIKQHYILSVRNQQSQKLGAMLHLPIKSKQDRIDTLLKQTFKYEYDASFMTVPNKVGGTIVFEDREKRFSDILFDRVVKIEDVPNTTNYAYDLTVAETRNFDCINGLCLRDTFHLAGVSTKSNVTRGVPRIEEILRLTDNPKRPALTIHLKPIDETDKDRASAYATMIEHTKLIDVVDSVQICFDPNDDSTFIKEDKHLIDQFYEFERIVKECAGEQDIAETPKSKWMIRLAINPTALLDKNITMDDIHFAITANYPEITCIYSDYNDSNLVFRIRINQDSFKKKKGSVSSLDQSDEIYLLKNLQDSILNHIVLRGINGLKNILPRKIQNMVVKEEGKFVTKDTWVLDTTGTNLMDVLAVDFIDSKRTYSNDMNEVFNVLGIEAARQIIFNEFSEVMEFSDVYINYHHLSILCDRMTMTKDMVAIFRSGLHKDDIGPIAKATFEVHTEILLDAARHADFDDMRGVSANVMCGQTGYYGTGAFNILLDMHEIGKLEASDIKVKKGDEIEELFGLSEKTVDTCSKQNIMIQNHISAIHQEPTGFCEDTYDMGF
jgi:DNA-directed RNA polymerase beta' subunit